VPLDHYADNVRYLIELTKQYTRARIIWATITPMDQELNHATHAATTHPARRVSDICKYNEAAVRICNQSGVQVNDLYAFIERVGASTIRSTDGVHFTDEGSRLLGKEVARVIRAPL
jgi:lysophospholipase L1-like esterase